MAALSIPGGARQFITDQGGVEALYSELLADGEGALTRRMDEFASSLEPFKNSALNEWATFAALNQGALLRGKKIKVADEDFKGELNEWFEAQGGFNALFNTIQKGALEPAITVDITHYHRHFEAHYKGSQHWFSFNRLKLALEVRESSPKSRSRANSSVSSASSASTNAAADVPTYEELLRCYDIHQVERLFLNRGTVSRRTFLLHLESIRDAIENDLDRADIKDKITQFVFDKIVKQHERVFQANRKIGILAHIGVLKTLANYHLKKGMN